jgi:hypothetical protein
MQTKDKKTIADTIRNIQKDISLLRCKEQDSKGQMHHR